MATSDSMGFPRFHSNMNEIFRNCPLVLLQFANWKMAHENS